MGERKKKLSLSAHTYCFISQTCLCLHLPWVDFKAPHPVHSFIEEKITVTSLFWGIFVLLEKTLSLGVITSPPPPIPSHPIPSPLSIDHNMANTLSCIQAKVGFLSDTRKENTMTDDSNSQVWKKQGADGDDDLCLSMNVTS